MKISPLYTLLALTLTIITAAPAIADEAPEWRHATALIGAPRNEAGFKHFKYVNVNAPKGGTARLSDNGTFDNLNFVIPKGSTPLGIGLIYESLMTSSLDEVSTMYGLVAEALRYPKDYSWVSFRLRKGAKWHDGKPISPEDVIFSFRKLTKLNPQQGFYYRHVEGVTKTGEREVTFTFKVKGNRELPHIVGQLMILPKHWWEGVGPKGVKRDIASGTLEPPLGSGAYRIKSLSAGRSITYERVENYWGKDLNVNVGQNNFAQIRYEYYRDGVVQLEAFKADEFDWREENTAKNWAKAYDIPAVRSGRILKELFPERGRGLMVGFIFNQRREKFADPRLREAFNYAFDFEEMNRTIFFQQYERLGSYFSGTALASKGLAQGRELEILETVRGDVPEEVFTKEYKNPVSENRRAKRGNLRKAIKLLKQAGWVIRRGKLANAKTGKLFEIEYLLNGPAFERVALRLKNNLRPLGIDLRIRTVDSSQYTARIRSRDYDLIYTGWAQSLSPGNELQGYFSAAAAGRAGSQNYAGIKNKAIDKLVQNVIFAKDRDELVAASKALDRVLLWNHMVVPGWGLQATRVARWDRFSHPEKLPLYSHGFPTVWWYDKEKTAKTGKRK